MCVTAADRFLEQRAWDDGGWPPADAIVLSDAIARELSSLRSRLVEDRCPQDVAAHGGLASSLKRKHEVFDASQVSASSQRSASSSAAANDDDDDDEDDGESAMDDK